MRALSVICAQCHQLNEHGASMKRSRKGMTHKNCEWALALEALSGYPAFYLYKLSGECRYSLVSKTVHPGAVFGYLDLGRLCLYGAENFKKNGGHAWGMNYDQHEHFARVSKFELEWFARYGTVTQVGAPVASTTLPAVLYCT